MNRNILDASVRYTNRGYSMVDVPWLIRPEIDDITRPKDARPGEVTFRGESLRLPASGEQSFIQMMIDGKLEPGRYQCITPCWRDDETDELHRDHFMKLELFTFNTPQRPADSVDVDHMIHSAMQVFTQRLGRRPEMVNTKIGKDIVYAGVELGSYGKRWFKEFKWVYGTGMAEPRFSVVQNGVS